jgi:ketosteroid isomerase-like protein
LPAEPSLGTTLGMDPAATELAIRARRALFNRAIASGDVQAIGPILARDCVMLTGTDSAVIAGRLAQVKVWRREFAAPTRDTYLRTPEAFDVSAVEPIAMEHGSWDATAPDGECTAAGTYAAKWRMVEGEWVIEAEVFVTMA